MQLFLRERRVKLPLITKGGLRAPASIDPSLLGGIDVDFRVRGWERTSCERPLALNGGVAFASQLPRGTIKCPPGGTHADTQRPSLRCEIDEEARATMGAVIGADACENRIQRSCVPITGSELLVTLG